MTEQTKTAGDLVLERSFEVPPQLVWQMWTDPAHFAAWYGPHGATVTVPEMDVRVGGRRLVGMAFDTPDGVHQMWFVGEHLEVAEHRRLAYTESMSDEVGTVKSSEDAGMPAGHPMTTQVTVELEAVGGGTKMTMTHAGVAADSSGAAGWAMAFDKLAPYLARQAD